MSFHFFIHLTPSLRPFLLPSPRARPLARRKLWAARTLPHFIISVGVGQAWPETDGRGEPFLRLPAITHADPRQRKCPWKVDSPFPLGRSWAQDGQCVSSWKPPFPLAPHSLLQLRAGETLWCYWRATPETASATPLSATRGGVYARPQLTEQLQRQVLGENLPNLRPSLILCYSWPQGGAGDAIQKPHVFTLAPSFKAWPLSRSSGSHLIPVKGNF